MGLITLEPLRIGDKMRPAGYELSEEDLIGRNIGMMKRHNQVAWVDPRANGEPEPRKRTRSPRGEDE